MGKGYFTPKCSAIFDFCFPCKTSTNEGTCGFQREMVETWNPGFFECGFPHKNLTHRIHGTGIFGNIWLNFFMFRLHFLLSHHSLVGGFNPSEKYLSNWESSPNRGENKKYLKPPRRFMTVTATTLPFTTKQTPRVPELQHLFDIANLTIGFFCCLRHGTDQPDFFFGSQCIIYNLEIIHQI